MKSTATLLAALAVAAAGAALAQHPGHAGHLAQATAAKVPMSDGEVRKLDKDAGKITLKHGPIKNLDMAPMTMVFQVKDKALLDKVKVGDKVRFVVVQDSGAYVVTALEAAK